MSKTCLLLLTIILITACEPVYHVTIKNSSEKEVLLEITFDKDTLEKYWNGRSYIPYLESYPKNTGFSEINFDSINLIKSFIIPPGAEFPLETGIDHRPSYSIFKSIQLVGKDTIKLDSHNEIENGFEKVDKRLWILKIR